MVISCVLGSTGYTENVAKAEVDGIVDALNGFFDVWGHVQKVTKSAETVSKAV